MMPAAHLQAIALTKINDEKNKLDSWSSKMASIIYDWCEEDAKLGNMFTKMSYLDLRSIAPTDMPSDQMYRVLVGVKDILEKNGYQFKIDYDFTMIRGTILKEEPSKVNNIWISWEKSKC